MRFRSTMVFGYLLFAGLQGLAAQSHCEPVIILERIRPTVATSVQGNIQTNTGALVAGLKLTLSGGEGPKMKQTIVTDDRGQFKFEPVAAGKYTISIEHTAGTAKKTEVQCDTNGVCQVVFTLRPPRDPKECRALRDNDMQSGIRQ